MKAGEIMHRPVLAATVRARVRDVATQLVMNRISGMPVTDRGGTVWGVITEADILGALIEGEPTGNSDCRGYHVKASRHGGC